MQKTAKGKAIIQRKIADSFIRKGNRGLKTTQVGSRIPITIKIYGFRLNMFILEKPSRANYFHLESDS
tara:strand:+ start:69 stop:272 length:204 start_codon:yes stop_codon:yes gene_type:complete